MGRNQTKTDGDWLTVRAAGITDETNLVRTYELVHPSGDMLPAFTAGAHTNVLLPSGLIRQYSLFNDAAETHRYCIAVQRENNGRGGSIEMHEKVRVGDCLQISATNNHFPLSGAAGRYLLIAGGIGITPIMSMISQLHREQADWALHYCTRTKEGTAFRRSLNEPPYSGSVALHHDGGDPENGLALHDLLVDVGEATLVYCCGPTGLMNAVRAAGKHLPLGTLHFEDFAADPDLILAEENTDFVVEIAGSGQVLNVPSDRTILDVLIENGIEVPHMCAEGLCGTCLVDFVEGVPEHRDFVLDDDEKAAGDTIAVCCSRAKRERLKLDI